MSSSSIITLARRGWVIQFIPFLITLTALCLTIASVTSCRFLLIETGDIYQGFGLFRFGEDYNDVCETFRHRSAVIKDFNDKNSLVKLEGLSGAHKTAQAAGILTSIIGLTCTLFLFLSFFYQCFISKAIWGITLPILLCLAAVTQGITFAMFGDDSCKKSCELGICNVVTCSFSEGADRAFAAMVLYLFMGIVILFYPRRSVPMFELVADHDPTEDNVTKTSEAGGQHHPGVEVELSANSGKESLTEV